MSELGYVQYGREVVGKREEIREQVCKEKGGIGC
jgi:hypothetical protein